MLRRDEVDAARLEVTEAEKALVAATKALEDNKREIKERNADLIQNNYNMAEDHLRVIKVRHDEQKTLKTNIEIAEKNLDRAKEELLDAQMRLEAMEKLREKREEEYYQEQNLIEQKQTDERATLKYTIDMMRRAEEEQG